MAKPVIPSTRELLGILEERSNLSKRFSLMFLFFVSHVSVGQFGIDYIHSIAGPLVAQGHWTF